MEPRRKKHQNKRFCHICGKETHNNTAKKHVQQVHLPWYLSVWCCFTCRRREQGIAVYHKKHGRCIDGAFTNDRLAEWLALNAGFLYKLCDFVLGSRDLFKLLHYVTVRNLFHGDHCHEVTPHQSLLWSLLNAFLSNVSMEDEPVNVNPPNSLAALLHHTVLIELLLQLSPDQRAMMRTLEERVDWDGRLDPNPTLSAPYAVADSHFHLFKCNHVYGVVGLQELGDAVAEKQKERTDGQGKGDLPTVHMAVNNCVYPAEQKSLSQFLARPPDPTDPVVHTIGYHPKNKEKVNTKFLLDTAEDPRVVAIGECGVDISFGDLLDGTRSQVLNIQGLRLLPQIEVAHRLGLPLVLHLRDPSEITGEDVHEKVSNLIRAIFKDPEMPADQKIYARIHLHCYTGNLKSTRMWLEDFPGAMFGAGKKVEIPDIMELFAQTIPLDRVLLESDAPFLTPVGAGHVFNAPHLLCHVLRMLAGQLNIPESALTKQLSRNCVTFYRRT